ncbi:DUF3122 domain-containing protein [Lyngbya confervoides]|uniref:DUF3122 domain-containing protein n=1 Tax=Lyngbya confervoides BDU141951 TaxID=1574623 RepID=A0ABD4T1P6_9CYAN|nr:DUF3122 domain-containing protein [Lyngbya confervoides]MCM1982561.1 DUF3122 domain-containing protein [Lyngbya confervoides BDU141951]
MKFLLKILILGILGCLLMAAPVQATVHVYPESSTQVMVRSRRSVQDDQQQAWQAIVFKRLRSDQTAEMYLRLIAFPGAFDLTHPQALRLRDQQQEWILPDVTAQDPQLNPVSSEVGQYDLAPVMRSLDRPTRLNIEVAGSQGRRWLRVPQSVVREWWDIKQWTPPLP